MFRKIKIWSRYHQIQLFGIMLVLILLVLSINCVSIGIYASNKEEEFLRDNAIFVNKFTTSLSKKSGTMPVLYVNPSRTKCILMFKFDSVENLVIDASKYRAFIKSYDVLNSKYHSAEITDLSADGGFYVFGTTGYMALYISAVNGFPHEAYDIIVRCDEVLGLNNQDTSKEGKTSFELNDQWRVIINPNGKNVKECDFIDDFDVNLLYQQAVIDANEEEIRNVLNEDISKLYTSMKNIESYRTALANLKVRVPALPDYVNNDVIELDENNKIVYKPNYLFENGVNYEWQNNTLHDVSFLDMVKPSDITDIQFFNSLNDYSAKYNGTSNEKWYMEDGTQISFDSNENELTSTKAVVSTINAYRNELSNYYNTKKEYHCSHLVKYLYIEANMKSDGQYFTANYTDNAVTVW